jgi:hypothetical protein
MSRRERHETDLISSEALSQERLDADETPKPSGVEVHLLDANRELAEVVYVAARGRLLTRNGVTYHHVDTVGDVWRYAPEP